MSAFHNCPTEFSVIQLIRASHTRYFHKSLTHLMSGYSFTKSLSIAIVK